MDLHVYIYWGEVETTAIKIAFCSYNVATF